MLKVTERIFRTADGRLVREADPEAAFLAYPVGAEVSDEEAKRVGLREFVKRGTQPQDKLAPRARDKAVTTDTKEHGNA